MPSNQWRAASSTVDSVTLLGMEAFVSTGPTAIESGFLQHLEGLRVG